MLSSTRSRCGDHLLRLRAAKSPRQKTNSTVLRNLAKSSPSSQGRRPPPQYSPWMRRGRTYLPEFGQVLCPPPPGSRSCGPQMWGGERYDEELYSTCASPVVPHPSTGHAHGCLASEIGRDPAFPTRFDRTVDSLEVSLLASSSHWIGTESEKIV